MCQTRAQNGRKNLSNGLKNHQTGANSNFCQGIPTMGRARKPKRANSGIFYQTCRNPSNGQDAPLKIQVLANSWIVYNGKSQSKMDDEQGYLHFRKPPYNWNTLQKVESGPFGSIIYQLQRFYWYDLTVVSPIINLILFGSYTGDTFHFFWATGDSFGSWRPYWLDILCGFVRKLATPFHPLVYHSCSSPCSEPKKLPQKTAQKTCHDLGYTPHFDHPTDLSLSFTMAIHGPSQRPSMFHWLQPLQAAAVDDGPVKAQWVVSVFVWGIQPKNQWMIIIFPFLST